MSQNSDGELPKQISIDYYDDYMHICRKWFGFPIMLMSGFMVFWIGIQFFTYFLITGEFGDATVIIYSFGAIFLLIDVFLFYLLAAGWMNKTDIFVNKQLMEIKHSPVPWMGNKKLDATTLTQFYVHKSVATNDGRTTVTYEVHYLQKGQQSAKLIAGLAEREQAVFIEQKIENYLGIIDVPI